MKRGLSLFLAIGLSTLASLGAELGISAPELDITKWVKGDPITIASGKGKNIYVVEFWATWCGPCRTSIPHLTELQKKLKDQGVIFIGVTDEEPGVVEKFVKKMGDTMDYRVAIDGGKTTAGYMKAFGVGGIPHAFVVDKQSKIVWEGHPMSGLDEVLEQIAAGKYDLAKVKAEKMASETFGAYFQEVGQNPESEKAKALEKEVLQLLATGKLPFKNFDLAKVRQDARFRVLARQVNQNLMQNNEAEARKAFDEIEKIKPGVMNFQEAKDRIASNRLFNKWFHAATLEGEQEAEKVAREIAASDKTPPMMLNELAWSMLTNEDVKHRTPAVALEIAKKACERTEWKEAAVLDTYARALFDNNKKEDAIKYQKQAIELAEGEEKEQYQEVLNGYLKK